MYKMKDVDTFWLKENISDPIEIVRYMYAVQGLEAPEQDRLDYHMATSQLFYIMEYLGREINEHYSPGLESKLFVPMDNNVSAILRKTPTEKLNDVQKARALVQAFKELSTSANQNEGLSAYAELYYNTVALAEMLYTGITGKKAEYPFTFSSWIDSTLPSSELIPNFKERYKNEKNRYDPAGIRFVLWSFPKIIEDSAYKNFRDNYAYIA